MNAFENTALWVAVGILLSRTTRWIARVTLLDERWTTWRSGYAYAHIRGIEPTQPDEEHRQMAHITIVVKGRIWRHSGLMTRSDALETAQAMVIARGGLLDPSDAL